MSTHLNTIQTRSYGLVGTVVFRADALRMVPLDDPTAWGNNGLEGFDEDYIQREFKSKAAAVKWLRSVITTDEHCYSGEVSKIEWEADEFDDDRYGEHVLDGIETCTYRWYVCQRQDGSVVIDDGGKPYG